jgi:hypothetical protein
MSLRIGSGMIRIGIGRPSISWSSYPPTGLTATVISDTQIDLAWTNVDTKGDGVKVYMSTDGVTYILKSTVVLGVTTANAIGLTEDTLYYFYVISYKGTKESDSSTTAIGTTFVTAYNTVLTAMTNKPVLADKLYQNDWLKGFVDNGLVSKAELLDMFSVHVNTASEAFINWKNPGTFNPSGVNTPAFEAYSGFTGNVAGVKYVRLNFIPSSDGTLVSQNSICAIVGVSSADALDFYDFGATTGVAHLVLNSHSGAGGSLTTFCNSGAPAGILGTSGIGHFTISRGAAANYDNYYNFIKENDVVVSNGVCTNELYTCGYNSNGVPSPSERQIRYIFLFSYLTEIEVQIAIILTENYLRKNAKGLISGNSRFMDNFIEAIPMSEPTALVSDDGNQIDLWANGDTGGVANIHYSYSTNGKTFAAKQATDIPVGFMRCHILKDGATYYLYASHNDNSIHLFTSTNKINFTDQGEVLAIGAAGAWDDVNVSNTFVWKEGSSWYMLYDANGTGSNSWQTGLATSANGILWTKYGVAPVIPEIATTSGAWQPEMPRIGSAIIKNGGNYYLYYSHTITGILKRAYSADLHTWTLEGDFTNLSPAHSWSVCNGDQCLVQFKGKSYLFWSPTDQISISHIDCGVDNRTLAELLAIVP